MILFRWVILGMTLLYLALPLMGQGETAYVAYYGKSLELNNIGMGILGGWALANITTGAYGWSQQSGQASYFHQMNLFWNTVNIGIAGFALYSNLTSDYKHLSGDELLMMQLKSQRLFLINAGIDVAYVATGLVLKYLAPKYPKNEERLHGYGNSVILQGSFLFVFDLVMFGLHRNLRTGFMQHLSFAPMQEAWGLTLIFH